MLHQLYSIPRTTPFLLACSGGVDSMAALDFFRRGGKRFTVAYFDHGTGNAVGALPIIQEYTNKYDIHLVVGELSNDKPSHMSPEEFWRQERYRWFCSLTDADNIVTAHHLDDCAEGWIFSALHGNPKVMQPCTMLTTYGPCKALIRPFLANRKQQMIDWCVKHNVKWYEDLSNQDTHYPRNFIRHELIQQCLRVNPGLHTVIRKKLLRFQSEQ